MNDIEWTCLRKRRFDSRRKAINAARRGQAQFGHMRSYRCPYGSPAHWHVGHDRRERESRHASLSRTP